MDLGKTLAATEKQKRLRHYQTNLYALCTEILGYDKLTETFHRPMLDDLDVQRREGVKRSMELWPRGHYKTTVRIGQMVQDLLIDPDDTILVSHAVEDEVHKIVEECGQHFQKNKELRGLRSEIMPGPHDRRFLKSLEFTIARSRYNRQPSVLGKSSNSEITGAHVNKVYLDDIVGRNTIEDSALPKVASWFRNTIMPVLNPGGTIRVTGTRWDIQDPYGEWLRRKRWRCRVRAALETDGVPDWKGEPVLFTRDELRRRREEMGESDFAFQMMNDPSPSSDKPWDASACEHVIGMRESESAPGAAGRGAVFVLSDPAPAREGSRTQEGEKQRADGTKDDWAICVVKIMVHNGLQIAVLLDLSTSKEWTRSAGLDEACRLMRKWGTQYFFNESYGGMIADYTEEAVKAARRNGVPMYLDERGQLPQFKSSYGKGAKNVRFGALSDWARTNRFYICGETVPEGELAKFLDQARTWRPLPNGRNTCKWDDAADIVSRVTDPALQKFSPNAQAAPMSPFMQETDPDWMEDVGRYRSRYTLA